MPANDSAPACAGPSVVVAVHENTVLIRVVGRGVFACAQNLREFALRMLERKATRFVVDLSGCEGMDSTFMGILTLVALRGRARQVPVEILNASATATKSLGELGVKALFRFVTTTSPDVNWQSLCGPAAGAPSAESQAQTVLEAHEALIQAAPENEIRFRDVVDFLRAEMKEQAPGAGK